MLGLEFREEDDGEVGLKVRAIVCERRRCLGVERSWWVLLFLEDDGVGCGLCTIKIERQRYLTK